jgi:hypothetical protein
MKDDLGIVDYLPCRKRSRASNEALKLVQAQRASFSPARYEPTTPGISRVNFGVAFEEDGAKIEAQLRELTYSFGDAATRIESRARSKAVRAYRDMLMDAAKGRFGGRMFV